MSTRDIPASLLSTEYVWIPRGATSATTVRLEPDGISIENTQGRRFDSYKNIREVQLTPPVSDREPITYVMFDRKEFGFHVLFTVWGPIASAPEEQRDSYNAWVLALHKILLDRGLSDRITFKCGIAMNVVGWLIDGYPLIRATALILAPIGAVAGLVMHSFGFVVTCVGGGIAMLLAPKYTPPNVPKDLRRIRKYSPEAIPEGCLAAVVSPAQVVNT